MLSPPPRSRAHSLGENSFKGLGEGSGRGEKSGGSQAGGSQRKSTRNSSATIEGEAAPVRAAPGEAAPRAPAQERVFGAPNKAAARKSQYDSQRSSMAESMRNSSFSDFGGMGEASKGAAPPPLTKEELAAQQKAWEAACADFDRNNDEWIAMARNTKVPSHYQGARPKYPNPTEVDLKVLISGFTKPEPQPLHQRYLLDLLVALKRQWECPPPGMVGQSCQSVIDIEEPPDGSRVLIVGDTHGQLADVLWIFAE